MNWKRGLVVAAINLALAVPIIVIDESRDSNYQRSVQQPSKQFRPVLLQDDTVGFDLKTLNFYLPPPVRIVQMTNLPASILSGWHNPAHSRFTVAGAAEAIFGGVNRRSAVFTATGFLVLLFAQWLILASRPIVHPSRRWLEPTIFITTCAFLALGALALEGLYAVPMMAVMVTWFVLLVLGVVRSAKAIWTVARRLRVAENR
jgi:hypothetical protein